MLSVPYARSILLLIFHDFSIMCDCYKKKKKNLCTFYFLAFAFRPLLRFPFFPPKLMLCSEAAGTQKI